MALLTVRVPDALYLEAMEAARRDGRSLSASVREFLVEFAKEDPSWSQTLSTASSTPLTGTSPRPTRSPTSSSRSNGSSRSASAVKPSLPGESQGPHRHQFDQEVWGSGEMRNGVMRNVEYECECGEKVTR